MTTPPQHSTLTWDSYLRTFWLYWFLGSMGSMWLLYVTESLGTIGLPRFHMWFFCTVYIPLPIVALGIWQLQTKGSYRGQTIAQPDWVPVLASVASFVMWGGGYYLIGYITGSGPMRTLNIAADSWFPLIPETSFVYITVQWFVIIAVAVAADVIPWQRILLTCGSALLVCDAFFLFFPVHITPDPVPVTNIATWVISLIRFGDVSNNCFPSSHCAMALLSALFLFHRSRWMGVLGLFSAIAIGISTLTTKQHYVLDVIVGFAIAGIAYIVWFVILDKYPIPSQRSES